MQGGRYTSQVGAGSRNSSAVAAVAAKSTHRQQKTGVGSSGGNSGSSKLVPPAFSSTQSVPAWRKFRLRSARRHSGAHNTTPLHATKQRMPPSGSPEHGKHARHAIPGASSACGSVVSTVVLTNAIHLSRGATLWV